MSRKPRLHRGLGIGLALGLLTALAASAELPPAPEGLETQELRPAPEGLETQELRPAPEGLEAQALRPAPQGLDAKELARRADDSMRSDRTFMAATMEVESPRLTAPRKVRFRSWEDRPGKRSFVRIEQPPKDAGSGFLKLHPNLWMFIAKVERTMRIPPSMMLQSWMGSDFTNDDLVRSSSNVEDYEHRVLGISNPLPHVPDRDVYVVEYIPHEDAAVVWGRIVSWVDTEWGTPYQQDFYDEDGERIRVMRLSDVRTVSGRHVPHRWQLEPLDKQGHRSTIVLQEVVLDADFDDSVFTTRNLEKQGRGR